MEDQKNMDNTDQNMEETPNEGAPVEGTTDTTTADQSDEKAPEAEETTPAEETKEETPAEEAETTEEETPAEEAEEEASEEETKEDRDPVTAEKTEGRGLHQNS